MRKLVVGTFLTLDGVLQGPGGPEEDRSGGFAHGGWLVPYFDDTMGRIMAEWIRGSGGFVLGRKTYEIFAAHWPHVTNDPIAETLNTAPKDVASRTLDRLTWRHATLIRGDVAEAVGRLKGEPGRELQVHGSGDLIQTLLTHHLIDEFRLWVRWCWGPASACSGRGPRWPRSSWWRPGRRPPESCCRSTGRRERSGTGRSCWSPRRRRRWPGGRP
jgi:dihydrofolate reductase